MGGARSVVTHGAALALTWVGCAQPSIVAARIGAAIHSVPACVCRTGQQHPVVPISSRQGTTWPPKHESLAPLTAAGRAANCRPAQASRTGAICCAPSAVVLAGCRPQQGVCTRVSAPGMQGSQLQCPRLHEVGHRNGLLTWHSVADPCCNPRACCNTSGFARGSGQPCRHCHGSVPSPATMVAAVLGVTGALPYIAPPSASL